MKLNEVVDKRSMKAKVEAAYLDTFDEKPRLVRTVRGGSYPGGYFKIVPAKEVRAYLTQQTTDYGAPATSGHVGMTPDPYLEDLAKAILSETGISTQIYWRKRQANTPQAYLEAIFDRFPVDYEKQRLGLK